MLYIYSSSITCISISSLSSIDTSIWLKMIHIIILYNTIFNKPICRCIYLIYHLSIKLPLFSRVTFRLTIPICIQPFVYIAVRGAYIHILIFVLCRTHHHHLKFKYNQPSFMPWPIFLIKSHIYISIL